MNNENKMSARHIKRLTDRTYEPNYGFWFKIYEERCNLQSFDPNSPYLEEIKYNINRAKCVYTNMLIETQEGIPNLAPNKIAQICDAALSAFNDIKFMDLQHKSQPQIAKTVARYHALEKHYPDELKEALKRYDTKTTKSIKASKSISHTKLSEKQFIMLKKPVNNHPSCINTEPDNQQQDLGKLVSYSLKK